MQERSKLGIIYPLAAYTIWGLLPLYWKQLEAIPATDILAHRIFWSFLFLAVIILFRKQWRETSVIFKSKKSFLTIASASILISINWLIYIWAVNNGHIVEASLGYYINPLLTILLGSAVLHEKSDKWQVISIILAFTGVAYLTYQHGSLPWIALTLAVSFAIYGLVKKITPMGPLTGLTAETMLVAPFALVFLTFQLSATTTYSELPGTTLLLVTLSGIATSVPLLLFAKGAKSVTLTTLGFVQYLSPSISLAIGIFVFSEPFTSAHKISFGLIWSALFIYTISRREVLKLFGIDKH